MSNAHRHYRAIHSVLMQLFGNPTGHKARHVQTLTAFICGIVGSSHTHLPKIANAVPVGKTRETSLVTRLTRWCKHEVVTTDTFFLPVIRPLLAALAVSQPTIELIMDGSTVGRKCVAMVVSIVYRGRSLPIAWKVVRGKKGHLPETVHLDLLAEVQQRIPDSVEQVVFLGDGEFDGTALLDAVKQAGWHPVCRTAKNTLLWRDEEKHHAADMPVQRDRPVSWTEVQMTGARYGPVHAVAYWEGKEKEPIYLITTMTDAAKAVRHYLKRMRIETFFSDQKSRGFRLDKSHLSDPARLERLMIGACLGYIWMIYLGDVAHREGWLPRIHRRDRCDLSLFQVGMRLLQYLTKEELPIRVGFVLINEMVL